jgi:hypothetical protein
MKKPFKNKENEEEKSVQVGFRIPSRILSPVFKWFIILLGQN